MLPFFKRFKQFFKVRCYAARVKQYMLAPMCKNVFSGVLAFVRLNYRKEA